MALREIILTFDKEITETTKYGMPCFCYRNKALCYLWKNSKSGYPYVLFVDGNLMDHSVLEAGDRAKMKIFNVSPNQELPRTTLNDLLTNALAIRRLGNLST